MHQASLSIENIRKLIDQYDKKVEYRNEMTPREVCLSLVYHNGMLAAQYQLIQVNIELQGQALSKMMIDLIRLADTCQIDLPLAILMKMKQNAQKYPVNLVKGKSGKYTEYQSKTGIMQNDQKTEMENIEPSNQGWSDQYTFEDIKLIMRNFVEEREWNKFHIPRNVLLALTAEVGEVCELFQWKGDQGNSQNQDDKSSQLYGLCKWGLQNWTAQQRDKVAQELSDVFVYIIRLADLSQINLELQLIEEIRKMNIQTQKIPLFSQLHEHQSWFQVQNVLSFCFGVAVTIIALKKIKY